MTDEEMIPLEFTRHEWRVIHIILTGSMAQDYMRDLFVEDVKKIVDIIKEEVKL